MIDLLYSLWLTTNEVTASTITVDTFVFYSFVDVGLGVSLDEWYFNIGEGDVYWMHMKNSGNDKIP